MAINLHFSDLYESAVLSGGLKNVYPRQEMIRMTDDRVGDLHSTTTDFEHIELMHMNWKTASESVILQGNDRPGKKIGISFHTSGHLYTRFKGVKKPLDMKPGVHNLVYYPEPGDRHEFGANQLVAALQVNLDLDFFKSCIGDNDPWSDHILRQIETGTPFSAVDSAAETTLQMQQLIRSIVHCEATGPMRNLLLQSRVYELLSLQMDQFRSAGAEAPSLSVKDTEQLMALKTFLDAHFLESHHLGRLSRLFYMNEFKLKKGFKLLFGHTIFGYIRRLRMEYASLLLKDQKTVDEVAYQLGYENSQHFSTAFKKYYGHQPSLLQTPSRHTRVKK